MIMIFPLVQRIKILIGCSASILSSGTLEGRLHVDIILTNVLFLSLSRFPCLTRVMFHQNLRHSYLNKYALWSLREQTVGDDFGTLMEMKQMNIKRIVLER